MVKSSKPPELVITAPKVLVDRLAQTRGKFREILTRLLTDSSMKAPWREITRRIQKSAPRSSRHLEDSYTRLWLRILLLVGRSKTPEAPSLQRTVEQARNLIALVENSELDTFLYEFFPIDTRWAREGEMEPDDWPTVSEFLGYFAARAEAREKELGPQVPVIRRHRGDTQARYFVVNLSDYINYHIGGRLAGSVAAIASIALDGPQISKEYVKNAVAQRAKKTKALI